MLGCGWEASTAAEEPEGKDRSEGRLISLLEQSEYKTTDAEIKTKFSETGAFRVPSAGVEEAGCSREMQSSLAHLDLNESPIKSFVSVSEAADCLVDFKSSLLPGQVAGHGPKQAEEEGGNPEFLGSKG